VSSGRRGDLSLGNWGEEEENELEFMAVISNQWSVDGE
jgi:hypothetical protein